jgi:hypothetical protein
MWKVHGLTRAYIQAQGAIGQQSLIIQHHMHPPPTHTHHCFFCGHAVDADMPTCIACIAFSVVCGEVCVRLRLLDDVEQAAKKDHKYVLCLDDDVVLHPSSLAMMVARMEAEPGVFMATGRAFPPLSPPFPPPPPLSLSLSLSLCLCACACACVCVCMCVCVRVCACAHTRARVPHAQGARTVCPPRILPAFVPLPTPFPHRGDVGQTAMQHKWLRTHPRSLPLSTLIAGCACACTGYPLDLPPPGANLLTYCVLVYHAPLLIAFSIRQRTSFVWGGCMLMPLHSLKTDEYGFMRVRPGLLY